MDHSDDDYDNLPASHPARRNEYGSKHKTANKHRGGWGEDMELAHQKGSISTSKTSSVVAVDLNQLLKVFPMCAGLWLGRWHGAVTPCTRPP